MNAQGIEILDRLNAVAAERTRRDVDPVLGRSVHAVKVYQHLRFTQTYADLLCKPRYASAARFFLDELYGPKDFGERDSQFARIVPGLVRLFPRELVETVRSLARLHALSEQLDSAMGEALVGHDPVPLSAYAQAWRAVSTPAQREQQISLMLEVGSALDRYTRNPLLRQSLRMMRRPAQLAGVGVLQTFLERGFDTFRDLRGAGGFLGTIAERERTLASRLFAGEEESIAAEFSGQAAREAVETDRKDAGTAWRKESSGVAVDSLPIVQATGGSGPAATGTPPSAEGSVGRGNRSTA